LKKNLTIKECDFLYFLLLFVARFIFEKNVRKKGSKLKKETPRRLYFALTLDSLRQIMTSSFQKNRIQVHSNQSKVQEINYKECKKVW